MTVAHGLQHCANVAHLRAAVHRDRCTVALVLATFFDFNGVLVDDEHLHLACFNDVLVAHGVPAVSEPLYNERYLGFDDRGAFGAMLADAGRSSDEARIRAMIAEKAAAYASRAQRELRLFDGAADAVRAAADKGPVLIVSGALRAEIELALGMLGVRPLVAHIIAAEDVLRCKPDPEGYVLALGWLRAMASEIPREHVVVIEDSLAGIDAARAAGLAVWAVGHSYPLDRIEAHRPARAAATLAELLGPLRER